MKLDLLKNFVYLSLETLKLTVDRSILLDTTLLASHAPSDKSKLLESRKFYLRKRYSQLKSKDMVTERNNLLEETKQNLEELAVVKKQLGDETR